VAGMGTMDWFAPIYATVVTGVFLATVWARPSGFAKRATPILWVVLFAMGSAFLAARVHPPAILLIGKLCGVGAFLVAAYLAWVGSHSRQAAGILLSEDVRAWAQGRIEAREAVTSPGGIVCAAYQSEVFESEGPNQRGNKLYVQHEAASLLRVRTQSGGLVHVGRARALFGMPPTSRPCQVSRTLEMTGGEAVVHGMPPVDAVSVEQVAKLGDGCTLVGTLQRTAGGEELVGRWDCPAMIVFGDRGMVARALAMKARVSFVGALGLCCAAACLLAR
jgi:hypothetical protein